MDLCITVPPYSYKVVFLSCCHVVIEPGLIMDQSYNFLFNWSMLVKGFCAGIVIDFN